MNKSKSWWNKKWGKESICPITLKRLRPGKDKSGLSKCIFLNCGHGFYRESIEKWFNDCESERPSCPMCRKPFDILYTMYGDIAKNNRNHEVIILSVDLVF